MGHGAFLKVAVKFLLILCAPWKETHENELGQGE